MRDAWLKDRLAERLDATGKKPTPLALSLGRARDFLTDILNGRKVTLPSDVITPLAIALDCDERYFTDVSFASPGGRRRIDPARMAEYAEAARSGIFSWAWRDFRRLSLQDVAADSRLTPGTVSDIEQGLLYPDEDQITALAKAFEINPGMLRTNPFETGARIARLVSITEDLDPRDQTALIDMAEVLRRSRAG